MKNHRCPGCGQFEKVVVTDQSVSVGCDTITESSVLKYCKTCRDGFSEQFLSAPGRCSAIPTGAENYFDGGVK